MTIAWVAFKKTQPDGIPRTPLVQDFSQGTLPNGIPTKEFRQTVSQPRNSAKRYLE